MNREQEQFVKKFVEHLFEGDAAIFAGAGLSAPLGYVNWSDLLREIADELDLNVDKETDLITLAQFHHTQKGRYKINQKILTEFSELAEEHENHRIIVRLPISTIWTTNYDRVIEATYARFGKRADVKYRNEQFSLNKSRRDVIIYKMHGDVEHSNEAVITKYDYQEYPSKHQPFVTALSGDLVTKTFLFLGFSFTDPNLDYILSRVRQTYGNDTKPHYCIFRRVRLGDRGSEDNDKLSYNTVRQKLMIEELHRSYHITTILVDDYSEITTMLAEIEKRYKQKTIFISGSAATYEPHSEEIGIGFIHKLSSSLVRNGFTVVNGFGLGIGSAVINGALEAIYSEPTRYSESQLIMRPFPQFATGDKSLPDLWHEYREKMISYAGIALFVFGNKLDGELNINAPGILKELDIAERKGLFILPIGATGYQAEHIWNHVREKYKDLNPDVLSILEALQDKEKPLDSLIQNVIKVLNLLNRK